jgi:hypothetical protein
MSIFLTPGISLCEAKLAIRLLYPNSHEQHQIVKDFREKAWFDAIENLHEIRKGIG